MVAVPPIERGEILFSGWGGGDWWVNFLKYFLQAKSGITNQHRNRSGYTKAISVVIRSTFKNSQNVSQCRV